MAFIFKKIISKVTQNCQQLHNFVQSKTPIFVKSLDVISHGNPIDVLKIKETKLRAQNTNQVLVKILAAPIHPIDLSFIRGHRPPACAVSNLFPCTPGKECVGKIVSVGSNVHDLVEGQRVVVPFADTVSKRGTWTTYGLYEEEDLLPIPEEIGIREAATLTYAPVIAYRILKDFMALNPGDGILYNGGNSAIGQALHQLCKAWSLQSFSIVRPGSEDVPKHLKSLGATECFTLETLLQSTVFEDGTFAKPLLTLSIVGRSSSKFLGNYIDRNGISLAHGCMAGYPTAVATTGLLFKDFVQRPFWITRWSKSNPQEAERCCMFKEIIELIESKKFCAPPATLVPFKDYKDALCEIGKHPNSISTKYILDMECEE